MLYSCPVPACGYLVFMFTEHGRASYDVLGGHTQCKARSLNQINTVKRLNEDM